MRRPDRGLHDASEGPGRDLAPNARADIDILVGDRQSSGLVGGPHQDDRGCQRVGIRSHFDEGALALQLHGSREVLGSYRWAALSCIGGVPGLDQEDLLQSDTRRKIGIAHLSTSRLDRGRPTPYDARMTTLTRASALILVVLASLALIGCERFLPGGVVPSATVAPEVASGGDRFPDVLAVELRPVGEQTYDVVVTISSPYDTPQRYADGWRVLDEDGAVLGTHTLLHDHASEQPFTRTQRGVVIPGDIDEVTVEGRDQRNGFGGRTITVEVPRS